MFIAIVQHTPIWVWGLLAALVAIGLSQTRPREASLTRITILPLVLLAFSLSGVLNAFGHLPVALGGWAAGTGAILLLARPAFAVRGASWSPETRLLHLPGSWLPLALILCLFALKYFAGVSMALRPSLASDARFTGLCSLAYGGFGGIFLSRALSLRALAARPEGVRAGA